MEAQAERKAILPYFNVDHVDIMPSEGSKALGNSLNALICLSELLEGHSDSKDNGLDSGSVYGLAYLLRLIFANLNDKAYGSLMPLNSGNVTAYLKEQLAKE